MGGLTTTIRKGWDTLSFRSIKERNEYSLAVANAFVLHDYTASYFGSMHRGGRPMRAYSMVESCMPVVQGQLAQNAEILRLLL